MYETGQKALEQRLGRDLSDLCYAPENSVVPRRQGGEQVADAVIVGGGMCGLVAVQRSLTFQAWYRAGFGAAGWAALDKIRRLIWMDCLRRHRKVLNVPIEKGASLDRITPEGDLLRLLLSGGAQDSILTRKLVMATGRDGTGAPAIPDFALRVDRRFWAHASDEVDFAALRGRRVAVVGAAGLDEGEILDPILSIAPFGWANRPMHILGDPACHTGTKGAIKGRFQPGAARDAADLAARADVVMLALPGYGHKAVLDVLAPHLRQRQAVIFSSHASFGARYPGTLLARRGISLPMTAPSTSIPCAARSALRRRPKPAPPRGWRCAGACSRIAS